MPITDKAVFRFAPSPNGYLHLGHAYSALLNAQLAEKTNASFLLRLEDIDTARCSLFYEESVFKDLHWLGLQWREPVRRQSDHFAHYRHVLQLLIDQDLIYPAFLTRGEVKARMASAMDDGHVWPRDPDGSPQYPTDERTLPKSEARQRMQNGDMFSWRLNMDKAIELYGDQLFWQETGKGPEGETGQVAAKPEIWGDVILARKDIATSYHLSVVVDDALQNISHVVRGRDLFYSTALHRLLQSILDLPVPIYHHHDLILNDHGQKLSKSNHDTSLRSLRDKGMKIDDIFDLFEKMNLPLDLECTLTSK